MKKLIISISLLFLSLIGFSQSSDSYVINDPKIVEFFNQFIEETKKRGLDIQDELLQKVDYILILPENQGDVKDLGEYDEKLKFIKISPNVKIDTYIFKIILFRELSHVLGVPYNQGSMIMYREKDNDFSYAGFSNIDILESEMDRVLSILIK